MKNRQRQLLLWLLSLWIWYTLFGFFVAPRLLKAVLLWQLPKQIHRDVSLAKIRLNPYTIALALEDLEIRETDGKPFVSCDEVYINLDPTALLSHKLLVSDVMVSNAYVHVQVNHDGSLNFSDILNQPATEPAKPSTGKPLLLLVNRLQIVASRVEYNDFSRAEPFATMVGPIDLTLHDFSTDPANQNPYGFTAATESGEKIAWRGSFSLAPIRSRGEFSIDNIKLNKYAPYYDDFINLTIHDGTLDVRAVYQAEFTDHLSVAQVSNLTVQIHSLKIGERGSMTNVVEFSETVVADAFIDLIAQTVKVGTTSTRGARFDLQRLKNGEINLVNLVTSKRPASAVTPTTTNATALPWMVSVHEVNLDDWAIHSTGFFGVQNVNWQALAVANIHVITSPFSLAISNTVLSEPNVQMLIPEGLTNLPTATPKPATTNTAAAQASLPDLNFGNITVTNGIIGYDDKSLQPEAAIALNDFDVSIKGLSSEPDSRAEILVNGRVDNIAPIEVSGHINPLNMDAATDLQVTMKGIDLVPVGPYSGRYLGYLLRKGKLSLNLKYSIDQRKLNAQNQIIVDQFTFGDKTDSPQAVKLPVKLGVAILKDRNGRILIDVPIKGRIDDPQFHYMGAVWHVVGSLFTKIFTAPFSMIGSMFGGGSGEELSYVSFAPGSAIIAADQTGKLDVLVKALTERPALNLGITGSIDPTLDTEPLKIQKLDRYLLELRNKRVPDTTNALTSVERATYLRQAYAEALPKILEIQTAAAATNQAQTSAADFHSNISNLKIPSASSETPSRAKKAAAELSPAEMQRQYLEFIKLDDDDLRQLAAMRVASAVTYFKTKGPIADDRLLVSSNPKTPVLKEGARAVFSLE